MAKKRQNKLQLKWISSLVVVVVLVGVFGILIKNTPQSLQQESGYQAYQNPTYGFTLDRPTTWEIRNDTQVFENGDVVAFQIKGPTQKRYTEFIDGARFIVSKPFSINKNLETWVKEYYDSTSEFSDITFGRSTYQSAYVCGLGCMRYFYTLINDKVHGVAIFAEGPDRDKMVYENTLIYMLKSLKFDNNQNSMITKEEAVAKVEALPEVIEYLKRVPNSLVLVNGEDDTTYMVQVYELKNGHSATFNWYSVDKTTGKVDKQF